MPVYKEKRSLYRVRIWKNGKKKDWKVRGTRSEAKEFEARMRMEMEVAEPEEVVRNVPSFSDFCLARYRQHAELHLKGSTWERSRKYQLASLMEYFGQMKLTAIGAAQVEEFKKFQSNRGLKAASINDLLKVLNAVLAYARELRIPCAELRIQKLKQRTKRRVTAWTLVELRNLSTSLRHSSA